MPNNYHLALASPEKWRHHKYEFLFRKGKFRLNFERVFRVFAVCFRWFYLWECGKCSPRFFRHRLRFRNLAFCRILKKCESLKNAVSWGFAWLMLRCAKCGIYSLSLSLSRCERIGICGVCKGVGVFAVGVCIIKEILKRLWSVRSLDNACD